MRFLLIDRILEIVPGERIVAQKSLALNEEYLGDHFPQFPVMPGVLMLETCVQAAAWMVRVGEDFAHSIVTLKEAKGVKYGTFFEPGATLTITAERIKQDERTTTVKAQGVLDTGTAVSARLVLERYNLAPTDPLRADVDRDLIIDMRKLYALLRRSEDPSPRAQV